MRLNDFLPVVSPPAVIKDETGISKIKGSTLLIRALPPAAAIGAAVSAIDALSRFAAGSSLISYPGLLGFVAFAVTGVVEYARAQYASYEANLAEYIESDQPKAALLRTLVDYPFVVHDLLTRGTDLAKTDEKGHSLLFYASADRYGFDLETFDSLFFFMPWSNEEKFNCFSTIAETRLDLLEHLIDKKSVSASNLTIDQQMSLWLSDLSEKEAELLVKMGCDPNVRDREGFTPLLKVALGEFHSGPALAHAQKLIAAGADPSATVSINGNQKNALRLAKESRQKDLELIEFFQKI